MGGNSKLLTDAVMQEMIAYRNIQPEDFPLLQQLATYNKTILTSYWHNFFLSNQNGSPDELRRVISELAQQGQTDERREMREMHEIFLELCQKYDWSTANNIVRVLERIEY